LICKSWNLLLINDRKLWMDILKRTQPFFEFLSKQLSDEYLADARKVWTEYFDFVEKNDNYCCHNIIHIFKNIQMVHFDLQELFQICRAQSYEIKFKIQQKRPDRQVKKKFKVDLGKDNLLKNIRSLGQDVDLLMIRCTYLIKIAQNSCVLCKDVKKQSYYII
jgi:hypothetical protein